MVTGKESAPSNFQRFLHHTTPVVPSQLLPKSEMSSLNQVWHPSEKKDVEFFRLSDLWKSIEEWSAYGVGVPIKMNVTGESFVQYYVPYLSAIQIFINNNMITRDITIRGGDGIDQGVSSDSISDLSDNCSENVSRWDWCSSEELTDHQQQQQEGEDDRLGSLYFQFFERASPFSRIPLMDKIHDLSESYPGLMSLRNVDLSPASWIAIAWYPLYHIPMGIRRIKDLATCFLNYHTLSSSFEEEKEEIGCGESHMIRLAPFGVASYKLKGEVWGSEKLDKERMLSYLSVADSWLKQLNVHHHDYNYYSGFR